MGGLVEERSKRIVATLLVCRHGLFPRPPAEPLVQGSGKPETLKQSVADSVRRDGILDISGVAGERPSRAERPSEMTFDAAHAEDRAVEHGIAHSLFHAG